MPLFCILVNVLSCVLKSLHRSECSVHYKLPVLQWLVAFAVYV